MQKLFDLHVGRRAHAWVLAIYRLTAKFPAEERFGVTSQLRRAATSAPTNVAEGAKRRSPAEYARFINVAESSVAEAEYLLVLSGDLEFAPAAEITPILAEAAEIGRMLHGLRLSVERDVERR
ncbi:MAG: four helix bundle protein [Deltaproteobacteria bacterium]|nr:four helix bundle protein [Deltaproteobacteria bacterium]